VIIRILLVFFRDPDDLPLLLFCFFVSWVDSEWNVKLLNADVLKVNREKNIHQKQKKKMVNRRIQCPF
jgi:hypothetical protein